MWLLGGIAAVLAYQRAVKVALVTSIPHGGPVEHAVLLARDLARLGVDVRAVACDGARRGAVPRARAVIPLRHQFDADRRRARAPLRARRGRRPLARPPVRAVGAARSGARRAARAHAARAAGSVPRARPGWRARLAYGGIERRLPADVLVAPSRAAARLLAERVGYTQEIAVVPNGVDVPDGAARARRAGRDAVRARAGEGARRVPRRRADRARAAAGDALRDLRDRLAGGGAARARARAAGRRSRATCRAESGAARARGARAAVAHGDERDRAAARRWRAGVPAVATRVGGIEETAPEGAATLVRARRPGGAGRGDPRPARRPRLRRDAGRAAVPRRGRSTARPRSGCSRSTRHARSSARR